MPQRLRHPLGFRERNRCELELRVLLGEHEDGVCQIFVEEHENEVRVRVLVHRADQSEPPQPASRHFCDCPVRLWLERPLGDRAVIDLDTDEELPLFTPAYLNGVPRPDHGYRAVQRRGGTPGPLERAQAARFFRS